MAWSCCVLDDSGRVLESVDPDLELPTASVGKLFLLCEVAERLADGRLQPDSIIERRPDLSVADSGLWQHLSTDHLSLADACVLIAAVSDNWATNAVLDAIGLHAVQERAASLGCTISRLHDRVRDQRGPRDAPTLSTGTASELADGSRRIHLAAGGREGLGLSPEAARLVTAWLGMNVDLGMVADPLGLDPLAHPDRGMWNKTGWDAGVRADVGVVSIDAVPLAYAAIATWPVPDAGTGGDGGLAGRERMRELGGRLPLLASASTRPPGTAASLAP